MRTRCLLALVILLGTPAAGAADGVTGNRVLLGQSAAFSGPSAELGKDMRLGIETAFREVNARGGVHRRRLKLIALDDTYEPEIAIRNTRRLINKERVFALIGAVGTPTSRSAVPLAAQAGVPYIAPLSGAAFLRDATLRNVVNLRASYDQETEAMVARLVNDLGIKRIAVMYQDDSFGRAGYSGVERALRQRKMAAVASGVYPRNTTWIKTGLLNLRSGRPEAVILIGAYRPIAKLIAWARHIDFNPVFVNISFVGSNALARELGPMGTGVFVTQVVPFPAAGESAIAAAYVRALAAYDKGARPGFVSFEGYLAGRLVIAALKRSGRKLSRQRFLANLRRTDTIDLDGFPLRYGKKDNQGSDAVFFTVIGSDGRYRPIKTLNRRLR